ncbi:hypothetical protein J7J13_04490 [bacterium]|nr:hypothetical protein [bacterium]
MLSPASLAGKFYGKVSISGAIGIIFMGYFIKSTSSYDRIKMFLMVVFLYFLMVLFLVILFFILNVNKNYK